MCVFKVIRLLLLLLKFDVAEVGRGRQHVRQEVPRQKSPESSLLILWVNLAVVLVISLLPFLFPSGNSQYNLLPRTGPNPPCALQSHLSQNIEVSPSA